MSCPPAIKPKPPAAVTGGTKRALLLASAVSCCDLTLASGAPSANPNANSFGNYRRVRASTAALCATPTTGNCSASSASLSSAASLQQAANVVAGSPPSAASSPKKSKTLARSASSVSCLQTLDANSLPRSCCNYCTAYWACVECSSRTAKATAHQMKSKNNGPGAPPRAAGQQQVSVLCLARHSASAASRLMRAKFVVNCGARRAFET